MEEEIIDIWFKGNVIKLIGGKNGEQYGDDWDDAPFEYNAENVYSKYIKTEQEIALPFEAEIEFPENNFSNSPYTMEDFVKRKLARCTIKYKDNELNIFFGDKIKNVELDIIRLTS